MEPDSKAMHLDLRRDYRSSLMGALVTFALLQNRVEDRLQ